MILNQQSLKMFVQSETSNETRESVPGTHDYQNQPLIVKCQLTSPKLRHYISKEGHRMIIVLFCFFAQLMTFNMESGFF